MRFCRVWKAKLEKDPEAEGAVVVDDVVVVVDDDDDVDDLEIISNICMHPRVTKLSASNHFGNAQSTNAQICPLTVIENDYDRCLKRHKPSTARLQVFINNFTLISSTKLWYSSSPISTSS